MKGGNSLQFLDDLCCTIARKYTHKHMDVIGLNRQGKNGPALLFALCLNQLLTTLFDLANQDRLTPTWTPDQMVDDQMHAMLISLVFKAVVCLTHMSSIHDS